MALDFRIHPGGGLGCGRRGSPPDGGPRNEGRRQEADEGEACTPHYGGVGQGEVFGMVAPEEAWPSTLSQQAFSPLTWK